MGRSKPFGSRGSGLGGRRSNPEPPTPNPESQPPGIDYRPIDSAVEAARALFDYAALWAPPPAFDRGWGAWVKEGWEAEGGAGDGVERLIGAILLEVAGPNGMIYGPVVAETGNPIEIASHLLSVLLPHAQTLGVATLFARPQGLDRIWVRFGFIPVPEADLPEALRGRPGAGLFGWRGGSAIWSSRKPAGYE